jgi:hypothetical protein
LALPVLSWSALIESIRTDAPGAAAEHRRDLEERVRRIAGASDRLRTLLSEAEREQVIQTVTTNLLSTAEGQRRRRHGTSDAKYVVHVNHELAKEAVRLRGARNRLLRQLLHPPPGTSGAGDTDLPEDYGKHARFGAEFDKFSAEERHLLETALTKGLTIAEVGERLGMRSQEVTRRLVELFGRLGTLQML